MTREQAEQLRKLLENQTANMTDEQILKYPDFVEKWQSGKAYVVGKRLEYNGSCPGKNFPFNQIAGAAAASVPVNSTTATSSAAKPATPSGNDWVRRLQKECNAQGFSKQVVDGIPGKNTLAGCPTCRRGARGNITRLIQERLNSLGFNCGAIDGIFGSGTENAVKTLQKVYRRTIDGIVGQNTWRILLGM